MAPASYGVIARSSQAQINGTEKVVIRRREFVGTTTNGTVTGFGVTALSAAVPGYDINPACSALFPWLCNIAVGFERFRFNKLHFDFIPGQSTATAGRFYAAVDYDYDDEPAASKASLMGNMTAVESAVWQPCRLNADPKSLNRDMPYRHVSCNTRGLFIEGRTTYAGFLEVGFDTTVQNCLMDLWVEYEVELVTPTTEGFIFQQLDYPLASVNATSGIATAIGTGFAGPVLPSRSAPGPGPITITLGGSNGVPLFNRTVGGGNITLPYALDTKAARGREMLELFTRFNVTGVQPNLTLGADEADVRWGVYDTKGVYLGDVNNVTTAKTSIGPPTGTGGGPGSYIYHIIGVAMNELVRTYVPARYVVPCIIALNAIGAGNMAFGFGANA